MNRTLQFSDCLPTIQPETPLHVVAFTIRADSEVSVAISYPIYLCPKLLNNTVWALKDMTILDFEETWVELDLLFCNV